MSSPSPPPILTSPYIFPPSSSPSFHVHFDLFSGCAGDMLLSSLLDYTPSLFPPLLDHLESLVDLKGPHRTLPIITKIIYKSTLPPWIKHMSVLAFTLLAEAESFTHRTKLEEVCFHEVGAVDSLIDVIGTITCLWLLNVRTFSTSPIPFSEGTVFTDHGILPVPAPATSKLMVGFETCFGPRSARGELVTPTGMAVLKALTWDYEGGVREGGCGRPPAGFVVEGVGVGGGTKEFGKHPNILRCFVGRIKGGGGSTVPRGVVEKVKVKEERKRGGWTEEELDEYWLTHGHEHSHNEHGHDSHGHEHGHDSHGHKHGHDSHGHDSHGHDSHGHEHGHDSHGHEHVHDSHGHEHSHDHVTAEERRRPTSPPPPPPPPSKAHNRHPYQEAVKPKESLRRDYVSEISDNVTISKKDLEKMVDLMVDKKLAHLAVDVPSRLSVAAPPTPKSTFWTLKELTKLECNIDDLTPEVMAHVCSLLMDSGALDVWQMGIGMKKGRSAVMLCCLCEGGDVGRFMEVIFRNTTTLGVRVERVERASIRRTFETVQSSFKEGKGGQVKVKIGWVGEDAVTVHPEFEDCKAIAEAVGAPVKVVIDDAKMKVLN
ncbi:hypothetical protein TrVE_jg7425 [Triparma verrucosa]|uniref:LarC family nickel insertion protein n=1 Tax=Triparma verrucosa TaxID=1606542 RepID=A0A9W7FKQ5_9STRA|nr:hypothetical protein TrVE_jg7425 [Triparma verrucosa]